MAGLMSYIVGGAAGAAKGVGDAMIVKAQQDRQDMLLALEQANKEKLQSNEFQHQDTEQQAGFAHADTAQKSQQDFQSGQTDKEIAAHHTDVQTQEQGASARSAAEIAGRHQDVATQTQAQIRSAQIRSNWEEDRVKAYADRLANGKPLNYSQALTAAQAAYKDTVAQNGEPTDSEGNAIPADTWITNQAQKLMDQQSTGSTQPIFSSTNNSSAGSQPDYGSFGGNASLGGNVSGGGLLNPSGTSTVTPQPAGNSQGALTPPAGANTPDLSKATATATNPQTGQKIYQVGNQWLDENGKPVQ